MKRFAPLLLQQRLLISFLLAVLALATGSVHGFTLEDLADQPDPPASYFELSTPERLDWLNEQLAKATSSEENYHYTRIKIIELNYAGHTQAIPPLCQQVPPLKRDFAYRNLCNFHSYNDFAKYSEAVRATIRDAIAAEDDYWAALLLIDFGWRLSQEGDVVEAFETYEQALQLAKTENPEVLATAMFNTATVYIVHGDESYIRKGIALLKDVREQSLEALNTQNLNDFQRMRYTNDSQLALFNIGVAYLLHLHKYDKALDYFLKVTGPDEDTVTNARTFAALAAAEIGDIVQAKELIASVENNPMNHPVLNTYVTCYQQLTVRRWDSEQSVDACLNLKPGTTVEVKQDVYTRLSTFDDPRIEMAGLRELKNLFLNKFVPQMRKHVSKAASHTEKRRLQKESELKSRVVEQERQLKEALEEKQLNQQKLFVSLFFVLATVIALIISQLRNKKKLAHQFEQMSVRDPLTGLGNRRYLEQQLERELAIVERALKDDRPCALGLFLFDVDFFKRVNDSYGYKAGDEVLVEIAQRMKAVLRNTDIIVRWGGEEFVYVARVDSNERITELAERIRTTIADRPFELSEHTLRVTTTIGAVKYPFIQGTANIDVWSRLISLADTALYHGKDLGRDCWVVVRNKGITSLSELDEVLTQPLTRSLKKNAISLICSKEPP